MGALEGRVAVVTGAGRGIGREHALLFAREGACVVVNDLGGSTSGTGADRGPVQLVVDEIRAAGGRAVANGSDVTSFIGAADLIQQAVDEFGTIDVLVNNAGILRNAYLAGMDDAQWDATVEVHLKGHFAPLRHATTYWRSRAKAGQPVKAAVINTTSASGTIFPVPGQANYGAAKAGIAALTQVAARELERYGVRVNAIAPMARTRLTEGVPVIDMLFAEPDDPDAFDAYHPANVSPLVAYLATESCPITGKVYIVQGGAIQELAGWHAVHTTETEEPWTIDEIAQRLAAWG
jgi:NAD(P)-dependent dehydrogenase (short-subunit alcohol dehydrogenase family)